jgi:hypothetical protein
MVNQQDALISLLQGMGGGKTAPGLTPNAQNAPMMQPGEPGGDPSSPDNTPEHENAESPQFEQQEGSEEDMGGQEQYSHADMIAHHDSIAGLIQVLVNMTNKGPKGFKMASPAALEAQQAGG